MSPDYRDLLSCLLIPSSHPVFLHFSVPLSLSRTFVVSRTELLAAGSPGNSACFLFLIFLISSLDPQKPGWPGLLPVFGQGLFQFFFEL